MLAGVTAEHAQRSLRVVAVAQLLEATVERGATVARHRRGRLIQRHHLRRAIQHRLNIIRNQQVRLRAGVEMVGE